MNSYRYRIDVTMTADQKGQPVTDGNRSLSFEAANHDDILDIAERLRNKRHFDARTSASLAIGLKLFTEVILQHRKDPLFEGLEAPLREFIQRLKNLPEAATAAVRATQATTPA